MSIRNWCLAFLVGILAVEPLIGGEPKSAAEAMKTGESLRYSGNLDAAIAAYTQAIRLDPRNAQAYAERARIHAFKHDFSRAVADYTEAIRLDPKDYFLRRRRAGIYEMRCEFDKAIADWTEAIRLAPPHDAYGAADDFLARAWLYDKKGNLDKAIADYTEAVRRNSYDAYVRCCRAIDHEKKGDLDKAISDYAGAVELRPDNAYMFLGRARLYAKKGDFAKAVADCTEAIRLKPDFAAAYALRSAAYATKGDHDQASADRDVATRLNARGAIPQDVDASVEIVRNDVGELGFANPLVSRYVPSIDNGDGSHRFSDAQLKEMAKTPLDRGQFLQYIEAKWPLAKLKAHFTPANIWPEGMQNLVPMNLCFNEQEIPVHKGKQQGFDRIFVYATEDDGKSNYFGSVTPNWRRWQYALNILRGKDRWVVIESVPNDFVDNPGKYLPRPPGETK